MKKTNAKENWIKEARIKSRVIIFRIVCDVMSCFCGRNSAVSYFVKIFSTHFFSSNFERNIFLSPY
jgi:hypothetical protein